MKLVTGEEEGRAQRLRDLAKGGSLTDIEAAHYLRCSMTKLNELITAGRVIAWRDGRERKIFKLSCDEFAAAQVYNAPSPEEG